MDENHDFKKNTTENIVKLKQMIVNHQLPGVREELHFLGLQSRF